MRAADLVAFVGRFHVLAVHLPIGVIVLAASLEVGAIRPSWRPRVDPILAPVLAGALASAIVAYFLGLALAEEGGHARSLVELHQQLALGTVGASAASAIAWWLHRRRDVSRWVHRGLLLCLLGALSATAHVGGSITHGSGYLAENAPAALQRLLGGRAPAAAPSTAPKARDPIAEPRVFEELILPLLDSRCVSCHGAKVAKSRLRLDDYDKIMAGSRTGLVVASGNASGSLLIQSIEKPLSDDEHMPPDDKPQLTAAEIELLRFWIDRGASRELRVRDAIVPDGARTLLVAASARNAAGTPPTIQPATTAPKGPVSAEPAVAEPPASGPEPSTGTASPPKRAASPVAAPEASIAATPAALPEPTPTTTSMTPATVGSSSDAGWARVAPILARRCGACHGERKQKGKLRTDSIAALLRGGEDGPAIKLGHPGAGTLIERVRLAADDPMHMPPTDEPQLEPGEVRLIQQWLAATGSGPTTPSAPVAAGASPSSGAPAVASAPGIDEPGGASDAEGAAIASAAPGSPAPAASSPSRSSSKSEASAAALGVSNEGVASVHGGGCAACEMSAADPRSAGGIAGAALALAALGLRRRSRPVARRASSPGVD